MLYRPKGPVAGNGGNGGNGNNGGYNGQIPENWQDFYNYFFGSRRG